LLEVDSIPDVQQLAKDWIASIKMGISSILHRYGKRSYETAVVDFDAGD
jgi:hypothetical protein